MMLMEMNNMGLGSMAYIRNNAKKVFIKPILRVSTKYPDGVTNA